MAGPLKTASGKRSSVKLWLISLIVAVSAANYAQGSRGVGEDDGLERRNMLARKPSPRRHPSPHRKPSPKRSPKPSPKRSPKPSPRRSPKPSPKRQSPKPSPARRPQAVLERGSSGRALTGGTCSDPQATLDQTNTYRNWHQAPGLEWDTDLAASATSWAKKLADKGCQLVHQGGNWGENLYSMYQYPAVSDNGCEQAVGPWYEEVKWYNFNANNLFQDNWYRSDPSEMIGHFTQLVWKSSKRMGCGMAVGAYTFGSGRRGGCKVVACRYYPPGNIVTDGYFRANVLPRD